MEYSAANQLVTNDNASVYAFLKDKATATDGHFYRRTAKRLGNGRSVRGQFNQINGLIAARLWEHNHSPSFDYYAFDPTARDQLLLLASRKENALDPYLEECAGSNASVVFNMLTRGPKKATEAIRGLSMLMRASYTRDNNLGDCYKSLALEFDRAISWAAARGVVVDNATELTGLLRTVRESEMVVLIDELYD